MCTVSVLRAPFVDAPDDLRWRVVFSRDERLTRSSALPPMSRTVRGITAAYPLDPDGHGTWIAATSAGLVWALLNEIPGAAGQGAERSASRGLVIPALVGARTLDEAEDRLRRHPPGRHRPFRLLVVGDAGVLEAVEAGGRRVRRYGPDTRLLRTSSSLAPERTIVKRAALFEDVVSRPSTRAQDAFHGHQWPADPAASVLMNRPDAATVSLTTIDAFARGFRLTYRPWPAGAPDVTDLPRAA